MVFLTEQARQVSGRIAENIGVMIGNNGAWPLACGIALIGSVQAFFNTMSSRLNESERCLMAAELERIAGQFRNPPKTTETRH